MRWAFTDLPLGQLALSWFILLASALFSVWAAARIFRAGMLRYGSSLDLGALARILRPSRARG
jgi:ABC-type Na+ efflux pump permease subunit